MILLVILIIILILCVLKHLFFIKKENLLQDLSKNLLLNDDFAKANIIKKLPKELDEKLNKYNDMHLNYFLEFNCNSYDKYIVKSKYDKPWTFHYKYVSTNSIKNKNSKTQFNIINDKCYIYSYNKNLEDLETDTFYKISITANIIKDNNNNIQIKPYLSSNTKNNLMYDKTLLLTNIKNKEIYWIYHLKTNDFNSLNWYIKNGNKSIISISKPSVYKINNINKFLKENKDTAITNLVTCSINDIIIKPDLLLIKLQKLIKQIYEENNKNPDIISEYSNLTNKKIKNIKSETELKKWLKILLNDNNCENIVKPVCAYNIYVFNKINLNNKIKTDVINLENFFNTIMMDETMLNNEEINIIKTISNLVITNFKANRFNENYNNNKNIFNQILNHIDSKFKNNVSNKKLIINIIPIIFESFRIDNLFPNNKSSDINNTIIYKNWIILMNKLKEADNKQVIVQFMKKSNNFIIAYGIDDFLNSLVYIILSLFCEYINIELNLDKTHINLINNYILELLKKTNQFDKNYLISLAEIMDISNNI